MPTQMPAAPQPRPSIMTISPYVGGRSHVQGIARIFKLSSNESALGPSPLALKAFAETQGNLHLYPEGSALALRQAIAEVHGLQPDQILCGNSSDELLHLLAQAYCGEGDEVLISQHGFIAYPIVTKAAGGKPVFVPERGLVTDPDAILATVGPRTKLIYLANPNNPTGSFLTAREVTRLVDRLPPHVVLVLDGAYAEFVTHPDYDTGQALSLSRPNVVMTRTFSKAYGLAGLRLGWLTAAPAIIDALNRIRGPFNVSIPAQAAGAAAVRDRGYLARVITHNTEWRSWLAERIQALGFKVYPSAGNFLLIEFAAEGTKTADKADAFLTARGLILRGVVSYGLPHCLRLSVGTEEANRLVVEALADFAKGRS